MKVSIRQGVFETNSSSVHSCSITSEKTYKLFENGEVWYKEDGDEYLPKDEAIKKNIEFIKENYEYDFSEEQWKKFEEAYKVDGSLYEAFDAAGEEDFDTWDVDPYELYVNSTAYWEDYHQYEDWSHPFKDSNGTKMIAWGYVGHD